MAVLRGMSPEAQGMLFELAEGETTVGRHETNVVSIQDGSVSSFHSCVIKDGGKFTLRDLDSTNGTRVNGERVTMRRLEPGMIVRFGSVEMMFEGDDVEVEEAEAAVAAAPAPAAPQRVERDEALADAAPAESFKPSAHYKGKGIWVLVSILGAVAVFGVVILFVTLMRLG